VRRAAPPLAAAALFGASALFAIVRTAAAPAATTVRAASSSATGLIVGHLASDLGLASKDADVFVAPLRTDEPAPRGNELAGRLGALLAGALGGAAAHPDPVLLATAQAEAKSTRALVYLQLEIARGQLRATADAYHVVGNVWDRARQPSPAPIGHAFAMARIDGEVRSYLAPVPLVAARVDHVATEDRDLLAVACGDVDDDGAIEIVTLGRRRATVGRLQGGRFVPIKLTWLRDLSGIAPAPLREPLAGLAIVPARGSNPTHIDLGITDRARGSRLDGDMRPLGSIAGVPFATPEGDACLTFAGSTLASAIVKCSDGDAALIASDIETPVDAIARATFVTADGAVHAISAARDPRTAELRVRSGGETVTLAHAGAQVALADLDQDGAPEIISSLDVPARPATDDPTKTPSGDEVVVTTWQPGLGERERSRTPVPSGVRAIAACPPDGGGTAPVVIATTGELWIVR
jgi:hypothetical protein